MPFCPHCEDDVEDGVRECRRQTYLVKGQIISFWFEVLICPECKQEIGSDEDDEKILNLARRIAAGESTEGPPLENANVNHPGP